MGNRADDDFGAHSIPFVSRAAHEVYTGGPSPAALWHVPAETQIG